MSSALESVSRTGLRRLATIGFEGRFESPGKSGISPRDLMAVEGAVTVEPIGDFALKGLRRPMAAYNVLSRRIVKI